MGVEGLSDDDRGYPPRPSQQEEDGMQEHAQHVDVVLYWTGDRADAERVLDTGFWDEVALCLPKLVGVPLLEERFLPFLERDGIIRVTLSLPEELLDRAAFCGWPRPLLPTGLYVFRAAELNRWPKSVELLSGWAFEELYSANCERWETEIWRHRDLVDALRGEE
jgi:hypothetical protein